MGADCCLMNHFKQTVPRKLRISGSGTYRKKDKGHFNDERKKLNYLSVE